MRTPALLALVALAGCAAPPAAPPLDGLTAREILALSPAAVERLPEATRASLRRRLDEALAGEAAEAPSKPLDPGVVPAAPEVAAGLSKGVRAALALDLDRRAGGRPPLLAASVEDGILSPLPVTSLYAPAGTDTSMLDLGSTSPPSAALAVIGAAIARVAPKDEKIPLRPLPSAPVAFLYSPGERVVYVNPVVLALRDDAADRALAIGALHEPRDARRCVWSEADPSCLEDAVTLRPVEQCVRRIAPECLPGGARGSSPLRYDLRCRWRVAACVAEPVIDSPCGALPGPCSEPCSIAGADMGAACGRSCGQICTGACAASGVTGTCDRQCNNACHEPCGTRCADGCENGCRECGASAGANTSRGCTKTCGATGARHTGLWTESEKELRRDVDAVRGDVPADAPVPLPRPPPLDPARPPVLRPIAVTGTRDLLAFVLPPLAFFWLDRRARRAAGRGAAG
jgi:hypothetical protein